MLIPSPLLSPDGRLLLVTRVLRLLAYGSLSVVLVLYLSEVGLSLTQIGVLISLTLVGDALISLWLTTQADRIGRRRMLIVGAWLMIFAGVIFAMTSNFTLLLIAAIVGVVSPSGQEVGPFLAIEQAALSQIASDDQRTSVFAWYNLVGAFSIAIGALLGGLLVQLLQNTGFSHLASYRAVIVLYAFLGAGLSCVFVKLSKTIEAVNIKPLKAQLGLGLQRSRKNVMLLSALFALDAFGGGFMMQSIVAYWFYLKFQTDPAVLGSIFFGANMLAGLSSLSAAWVAKRFGLLNTMVATHIPSNILLILVPFMPTLESAIVVLFMRFSISQMDVPTRQSYLMAIVDENERSAAAGVTGISRTLGASLAPLIAGPLLASSVLMSLPFILAGGLKLVYDFILFRNFRALKPPEER